MKTLPEWLCVIGRGNKSIQESYDRDDLFGETVPFKKAKVLPQNKTKTPATGTYMVGIYPTKHQKKVLNQLLKVPNHAYNYCKHVPNHLNF